MLDAFGSADPTKMPQHLFWGALHIDYSTAIRASVAAQEYSVCPRHWYIDARFRCGNCGADYVWSAEEQRLWFETYQFYVESRPMLCRECRAKRRDALQLRKEYDARVSAALSADSSAEDKQHVVRLIDELESHCVIPEKMRRTRDVLRAQLEKWNLK